MIDGRMFNLLRDQLAVANEEKRAHFEQVRSLSEEIRMLHESQATASQSLKSVIVKIELQVANLNNEISRLNNIIEEKGLRIKGLQYELSHNRAKRFAPTTEQAVLLNNRSKDKVSEERDGLDGNDTP